MKATRIRRLLLALLASLALSFTGCAQAPQGVPFHMYSSPLLEGESGPIDPALGEAHSRRGEGPGVRERQVYSYRRWGNEEELRGRRHIRPAPPRRAPLDTVTPPDRPVLRNYGQAVGVGRSEGNDRGTTDKAVIASSTPQEGLKESTLDANVLSAAYVFTVLRVNEVAIPDEGATNIPEIFRFCRAEGEVYHSSRPNIGDLVFFHNTYDANSDGRNNDWYTLVGIVEAVRPTGTVDFLAYHQGQVDRFHLNVDNPGIRHLNGNQTANSQLRKESKDDAPFTQYLSGQLFAGFCNVLGDREDLIVIDNWDPEVLD